MGIRATNRKVLGTDKGGERVMLVYCLLASLLLSGCVTNDQDPNAIQKITNVPTIEVEYE